jgi:hypothetical protein
MSKHSNANNRSNQMNPNNEAYWSSRGTTNPESSGDSKASTPDASSNNSAPPPTPTK